MTNATPATPGFPEHPDPRADRGARPPGTPAPKPFLRALAGEAVWPPPVWLMRQAGRYLPEYRATKEKAGGFLELCLNPELSAEVTFQPLRRFRFDAAILFTDLPILSWAMGQPLRYGVSGSADAGPRLDPVRDAAGVAALRTRGVAATAGAVMETVARIRAGLEADHPGTALIGFAGAPWTVACYMVDGRGGHGFPETRHMAESDPELFGRLIDAIVEAAEDYLVAQAEAGAEALMLFDSWAGLLPPEGFRRWVLAPTVALVARLRARLGPDYPLIGFPRLVGPLLPDYAAAAGVQGVAMDTEVDPRWAARVVPDAVALQGNLDPMLLVEGGARMEAAARDILAAMRGRPFVFNLGHGIVPQTPPGNVTALLRAVRGGDLAGG